MKTILGVLVFMVVVLSGCASAGRVLVKDCKEVADGSEKVCKLIGQF